MKTSDLKIVFLGTPEFALPALEALIKNDMKPFLVITQPDKPVGRKKILTPSPVKELALENNIKVSQPHNKNELKNTFSDLEVDVCVLVAYGMIMPDEVLEKPKHGFINIHPSLLPKYRGPSPIQYALLNGEAKTGVTVMQLTTKMDEGPIIIQEEVDVKDSDNAQTLHDSLSVLGADLVVKILPEYVSGKIKLQDQDDDKASYCKIVKREDGLVDWSKSAKEINNQFRAFWPWPGVFTNIGNKRLKIVKLDVLEGNFDPKLASGTLFLSNNKTPAIKCGQGAISLIRVQLEGRGEVSGQEFINGHQDLIGSVLG